MIKIDAWQPADGLILEPNALRAAIETTSCLALTAGPGAGKTEMLAQRADFLLRTGSCPYPKRILAISFKVDASKNLKERVITRSGVNLASRFDSYTFHGFAKRIIDRFRPLLQGKDALEAGYQIGNKKVPLKQIEFGDLVPLAIQILQKSAIARRAIRQTYKDVFLDEFQDCTNLQYELVKIAFQDTDIRLTAVGDTKQKIMGWAGAMDGIFEEFVTDFKATPLNMYRNFRSKPKLLQVQNEIIRTLDTSSAMPSDQLLGNEGEVFAWEFEDSYKEAEYLANLISTWINEEQIPASEIAVLISKQLDLYAVNLMAALENRNIPYRNEQQLQDLSTEPVVKLIVDYLSCLYGKRKPKSWIRLMNQLVPFADDETQSNTRHDFQKFFKSQRKEAAVLEELIGEPYTGWWDAVKAFLKKIGVETLVSLSADYESHARLKEVINESKLRIEELLNRDPDLPNALESFSDDQSVRILTIHKSKGLEFDSVIMMAIENEIFFGDKNENLCAFFVGVSRAKRRLILTYAKQREKPIDYQKRWDVTRNPQSEYFGYVFPFTQKQ